MAKPQQNQLFEQFYISDQRRVRRYALMFARRHHVPRQLLPDLVQAAFCEAYVAMAHWRADGGKTLFNWCAGPMKRAMMRCYRASCGSRAWGTDALPKWTQLTERRGTRYTDNLEEYIDLHRAIDTDPKPQHIVRLIMIALSVSDGVEIGRLDGIHKQTVSGHMSKTKQRLRQVLSA